MTPRSRGSRRRRRAGARRLRARRAGPRRSGRVAPVLEALTDGVEAGSGGDTAVLADAPSAPGDRQRSHGWWGRKPAATTTEPMPSARRSSRSGARRTCDRRGQVPGQTSLESPERSTKRVDPARGTAASCARRPPTSAARSSPNWATRPDTRVSRPVSRTPRACSSAEVEVGDRPFGAGAADQLQRGLPSGGSGVGHLVDGAREPSGGLHPPEDVHPAVAAWHPGVAADGQDDVTPGPVELVGDLHAGRRGAHHEHSACGELVGVAVLAGGEDVLAERDPPAPRSDRVVRSRRRRCRPARSRDPSRRRTCRRRDPRRGPLPPSYRPRRAHRTRRHTPPGGRRTLRPRGTHRGEGPGSSSRAAASSSSGSAGGGSPSARRASALPRVPGRGRRGRVRRR